MRVPRRASQRGDREASGRGGGGGRWRCARSAGGLVVVDRLLRLRHAEPVRVSTVKRAQAGQELTLTGSTKASGRCTIELICRRGTLKGRAPVRPKFDPSDSALSQFDQVYHDANDGRWTAMSFDHNGGDFQQSFRIPAAVRGYCTLRVYVQGEGQHAVGAANLFVRTADPKKPRVATSDSESRR